MVAMARNVAMSTKATMLKQSIQATLVIEAYKMIKATVATFHAIKALTWTNIGKMWVLQFMTLIAIST